MKITPLSSNSVLARLSLMSIGLNQTVILLFCISFFGSFSTPAQCQTIDRDSVPITAINLGISTPSVAPSERDPELMRNFEDAVKVSKQGNWTLAVNIWSELVTKVKQKHEQNHPLLLIASLYLAQAYRGSDQAKLALPILESMLQERTVIGQKNSSFDANLLEELSLVHTQLSKFQPPCAEELSLPQPEFRFQLRLSADRG